MNTNSVKPLTALASRKRLTKKAVSDYVSEVWTKHIGEVVPVEVESIEDAPGFEGWIGSKLHPASDQARNMQVVVRVFSTGKLHHLRVRFWRNPYTRKLTSATIDLCRFPSVPACWRTK